MPDEPEGGRKHMIGEAALLNHPEKGRADKRKINM